MSEIMTVLGPIATAKLGFTSMHEHLLLDGGVFRRRYERLTGDVASRDDYESTQLSLENVTAHRHNIALSKDNLVLDDESLIAEELSAFRDGGGGAVLDVSTIGLRSNLPGIQRLSEATGIHIVTSTGFYAEDSLPERYLEFDTAMFEAHMRDEIDGGIEGSGIYPGHIKVAMESDELTPLEDAILRAAARVCRDSGLSLTVSRHDDVTR